ncbi:MAG: triose-phosphate isomerase [Deltaproteobacteria bacterium]
MKSRTPLIAGNWKMNLTLAEAVHLVKALVEGIKGLDGVEVLVAPPFTALLRVKEAIGSAPILLAGQNMHWEAQGAFTGEVSAAMLTDAGCTHVILGHSERRALFAETDELIDQKAAAAVKTGLIPIVCIGETLEEREKGLTFQIIERQLSLSLNSFREGRKLSPTAILAYEPVWAIGTGRTATPDQAQEVHLFIRQWLKALFGEETARAVRVLYGGSVKPDNARDLMTKPDIDGALVGGASLKAGSFLPIVRFSEAP